MLNPIYKVAFLFFSNGKQESQGSVSPHACNEENVESTFHNPWAGTLSKLFCFSEALLAFVLYWQTLGPALIFPDRDEKHKVYVVLTEHLYR